MEAKEATTEKATLVYEILTKIARSIKKNRLVAGFVLTALAGVVGYAWKNADPPFVKAQIEEITAKIDQHIKDENIKDNAQHTDIEVLKNSVINANNKVDDVKEEQRSQRDLLIQLLQMSKQINKNTK